MSYISFYRKWRPQNFEDIIGQEYNIKTIKNAISGNRLSHCYIFCGPRGTGKTSTARILAKAINCTKGITPVPCNKCESCVGISNGSNVDVIEIDAASNRGINEIRELREKVKYLPAALRKKVYIIDEIHMLTIEAFNALLKVLEEPPEHVIFIMATTEPNKVIPTIMSRCQRFDFFPIPMDKIKKRLLKIAKSEKIEISDAALSLISKYADGSLRDADGILEQLAAFGDNKIEAKDISSLLGAVDLDLLFQMTDILIKKDLSSGIFLTNKIIESNQNLKMFVSEFIDHLYDLYTIKNFEKPFEIVNVSDDFKDKLVSQAGELQKEELEFYIELFTDLLKQVRWGESSKVFFKSAVIKAINFIIQDEKEITKRTSLLETRIEYLKEEINKINLSHSKDEAFPGHTAGAAANDYSDENDDFDIINSEEIDKMVSGVELSGGSARSKKKAAEIDLIQSNMDKICKVLKDKKISVYAMFKEAVPDRIENGIIYFSMDEKRKWHKDHLNKSSNIDLISGVIKEVTGADFKIKFEIGEKMKNTAAEGVPEGKTGKTALNPGGSKNVDAGNKKKEDGSAGKDVFNYFEKKFDIKE